MTTSVNLDGFINYEENYNNFSIKSPQNSIIDTQTPENII